LDSIETAQQRLKYASFEDGFFMFSWAKKSGKNLHNKKVANIKTEEIVNFIFFPIFFVVKIG
jgi:hypothetical protein